MDRNRSTRFHAHLDLTTGDCAVAQHTDASIVERMPFSSRISRLEDREFVFGKERLIHVVTRPETRSCDSRIEIGTLSDTHIG